ncbi:MAG: hypothetical protein EAZ92_16305 [Candidatus Kapaibacterium sp.]|nr:MAG: hypothetical protein EAZ92_16305 [Candidatus Kapabacteria bacterium]
MVANSAGTVIVAGQSGAFISTNTGASWSALNNFPPGRLTITSSGDFFVYGAGVWRFNAAQQRFDALSLGNALSSPSSAATVGIIRDMETNTSGTMVFLVVANKGVMRLPAIPVASASTSAHLTTTTTLRAATLFSSQATSIAVHPVTGRVYALLRNSLWFSDNDGITWQETTMPTSSTTAQFNTTAQVGNNAGAGAFSEIVFSTNAQRLRVGMTRILQYRGEILQENTATQGAQNLDSRDSVLTTFSANDITAMLERDDYTLYATASGLWAERREEVSRRGGVWSLDAAQLRARVRSVSQTLFSLPIAEGAQILDLQSSGSTILALTTKGMFSATEEVLGKANPFLAIPQKILRWRSCNDGLAGQIDNFAVQQNASQQNASQRSIITASGWLGTLPLGGAQTLISNMPTWKSLYTAPLLAETDSLSLQLQNGSSRSSVMFAQHFGQEAQSIWLSRPFDSLQISSTHSTTSTATGLQRYFTEVYRLPLGSVWLGSGAISRSGSRTNARTQPLLFLQDGTILAFARDTTQSRLAPTHVVRSNTAGRSWQREEIRQIPSNIALGNIRVMGENIVLGEDTAFPRARLFRSDDKGQSWFELATGRVPEAWAAHPTTGTVLLAGAPPLRSQKFGEGFEPVRGLPFRGNARFEGATSFAFSTHSQAVVMLVRHVGVFYSTNAGASFFASTFPENASLGTPRFSQCIALEAAPNGDFYALSQNAVWQSRNNGKDWQMLAQGLNGASTGDVSLHRLRFDDASNVFLSTSRGIFFLEQESRNPVKQASNTHENVLGAKKNNVDVSKNYPEHQTIQRTIQIAPNPASERACVKFSTKSKQLCRVELWSLRGELVRTVFSGMLSEGAHEIWCGLEALPQGVYTCRVVEGESAESAQIQVIR